MSLASAEAKLERYWSSQQRASCRAAWLEFPLHLIWMSSLELLAQVLRLKVAACQPNSPSSRVELPES